MIGINSTGVVLCSLDRYQCLFGRTRSCRQVKAHYPTLSRKLLESGCWIVPNYLWQVTVHDGTPQKSYVALLAKLWLRSEAGAYQSPSLENQAWLTRLRVGLPAHFNNLKLAGVSLPQ